MRPKRSRKRLSFWLAATLVPTLILGASWADTAGVTKEADDGLDVFFREAAMLSVSDQALPVYPDTAAGESKRIARDFPDAPPPISHTLEDMYPITLSDNECLECHDPANATSKDDLPIPESHFMVAVMGKGAADDAMAWVVKGYEKGEKLAGTRYNCSMCHTPQANNVTTPESRFVPARADAKAK